MKLYLPLACVALLSIGIAPTVAAEAANRDVTEAARAIAIPSQLEELPESLPAIAVESQPEVPLQEKSLIKREKIATKQAGNDADSQLNSQLTQNIYDNGDRQISISIPHLPPQPHKFRNSTK